MAVALMVTAILAGCSKGSDEPDMASAPMLIDATGAASRDPSPLGDKYSDFGVWAWKTNADASRSLVLGRAAAATAQTEYYTRLDATEGWTYEYTDASVTQYLRYWDRAALNYYFSAYAPYLISSVPANTTHTITASPDGVSISPISGNLSPANCIDWLEAHWERQIQPALIDIDLINDDDHHISELGDAVPLAFHHVLAETEFRIYSGVDQPTVLNTLSITLDPGSEIYTEGSYAAGAWTYTPSATSNMLYQLPGGDELSLTGTTKATAVSLTTLLQLPQSVVSHRVRVSATTTTARVLSGNFILPDGWQRDKKYIYYLCITADEIILADLDAIDWVQGEDITVTEPIVNW